MEKHPLLSAWKPALETKLGSVFSTAGHGDWADWEKRIHSLPSIHSRKVSLEEDMVSIDFSESGGASWRPQLEALHPWRKGPFRINDVYIDTEWRSNLKWARLEKKISPLHKRWVLDVGSGNGYYAWRMLGAGAARVIGIDPTMLHIAQFLAIKHLAGPYPVDILPLGIEDLPETLQAFDTVFSMGVLYHRRSPLDHLLELRNTLRPGGELVLETLIIEGQAGEVLAPTQRYAGMRNVWFIPSPETLTGWLSRCGFRNIRVADISRTTHDEQRQTQWMRFHSLSDFLDPDNPHLTREGLPAPLRAIVIADKAT